ncbi:MAG: DUF2442 domain-containing protein [Phycisphaerales bacterium]|nr:DUF2442 domain-containing protein [Phycisphaerales bacterium]
MNEIVRVRHVRDYVCYVEFDDGLSGEIDLIAYLNKGPVFAALADIEAFKQVGIDGGTLSWPSGADIAPERVYELLCSPSAPLKTFK